MKGQESGQKYLDGLVFHYNYLRDHQALGERPAEAAGAELPFETWGELAGQIKAESEKSGD